MKNQVLEIHEAGSKSMYESFGVPERFMKRLTGELSAALTEPLVSQKIIEGLYTNCKTKTEVLTKFLANHDMKVEYGLDLETANGTFVLGMAYSDALDHASFIAKQLTHHTADHLKDMLGDDEKGQELKKKLEKLLDDL